MAGTAVRVTLTDTTGTHGPFTLDVVIDDESARVVGSHWYYGHSIASDKDLWPVILKGARAGSGRAELEFGAGGGDDNPWWTDLRERPLKIGQRVTVWNNSHVPFEFAVQKIAPLTQLGS